MLNNKKAELLLHFLLTREEAIKYIPLIPDDIFRNQSVEYHGIWTTLKNTVIQYKLHKLPTRHDWDILLSQYDEDLIEDLRDTVLFPVMYKKIDYTDLSIDTILKEIRLYYMKSILFHIDINSEDEDYFEKLDQANKDLEKFDKQYIEFKEVYSDVKKLEPPLVISETDAKIQLDDENFKILPTPFPAFAHSFTYGGIPTRSLGIIGGESGGFKTGFLTNMARDFQGMGLNVYYIDTENSVQAIRTRLDQVICISKATEIDRTWLAEYSKTKGLGEIVVQHYVPLSYTPEQVKNKIIDLQFELQIQFDVIIWDYADKFISKRPSRQMYQAIANVYDEIEAVSVELDVVSITGSQVSSDYAAHKVVSINSFRQGQGKVHGSTFAALIDEVQFDIDEKIPISLMTWKFAKHRYGNENTTIFFLVDKEKNKCWNISWSLFLGLTDAINQDYLADYIREPLVAQELTMKNIRLDLSTWIN